MPIFAREDVCIELKLSPLADGPKKLDRQLAWELYVAILVRPSVRGGFCNIDDLPPDNVINELMAYPFEPAMLSSPGAGPEGWRHDGSSQVAAGVRAPVPGRGGLRRVAAGAPLGIGLRLPGVRPRPLLAARAQGPDPAMPGLPAGDLGDGGHGHAPQPPAAEGLVHRRPAGVATHKNGMSARQLWLQLGLGGYES